MSNDGYTLPVRKSHDLHVNNFGCRLLELCKQNNIFILNGRLETGQCTYHSVLRSRPVASLVDYLLTDRNNLSSVHHMQVLDINEFSDHCPIEFSLNINTCLCTQDTVVNSRERLSWSSNNETFLQSVSDSLDIFHTVINQLTNNEIHVNECIDVLSQHIHDISFACFGKKTRVNRNFNNHENKESKWFNNSCRIAKKNFYDAKRSFKNNPSSEN